MSNVLVIGSSNTDLVIHTPRFPSPGETLLGGTFFTAPGGKGANQAVAAARAGACVTFIARVGLDDFGKQAIANFKTEGIQTDHIFQDPNLPSGVAFILVDQKGENSIVVALGANAALSTGQLESAEAAFKRADICLLQLETPIETIVYAVSMAKQHHLPVILNPAPAAHLPPSLWPDLYLITPNETETHLLTGIHPGTQALAEQAAHIMQQKGVQNVIITLGARGALLVTPDQTVLVPAPSVSVVDTTAAGDAFNGALACAIGQGKPLDLAVRFACAAGALTVSKKGAQPALPLQIEILQLI